MDTDGQKHLDTDRQKYLTDWLMSKGPIIIIPCVTDRLDSRVLPKGRTKKVQSNILLPAAYTGLSTTTTISNVIIYPGVTRSKNSNSQVTKQ